MLLEDTKDLLPEDRVAFFIARAKRRNKRTRQRIAQHKLRKLFEETKRTYGVGAWYCEHKHRIIRDSVNSASVRKECNRRFRRRHNNGHYEEVANGGAYRKHEDYWWSVC